jgi:hypothetical protein
LKITDLGYTVEEFEIMALEIALQITDIKKKELLKMNCYKFQTNNIMKELIS